MERLVWTTPTIEILRPFQGLPFRGSDTSWVNLFLLRRKYKLEVAVHDGVLFRYYHGKGPNRQGYGFPLSGEKFDTEKVFQILRKDAADRDGIKFCLCDEGQKAVLSDHFDIEWHSDEGDNDYIYECEKWRDFAGRKYHHLKGRINLFNRLYPEATYFPIDNAERLQDALHVAHIWQEEHEEKEMPEEVLDEELNCITEAAEYWQELGMVGGVLYVDDSPIAATMASFLSTDCIDFHFDKAVGQFASAGATVVSRRYFAVSGISKGRQYFNLEEDVNNPGLRQSKETWRPVCKLSKYFGCGR